MLTGIVTLTAAALVARTADPLHYRIEVKSSQEFDLTVVGQAKQSGGIHTVAFVTVTMSDTVGGQVAHVVVDSLSADPSGIMARNFNQSLASDAAGAFFHAFVVRGRVQGQPKPSKEGNTTLSVVGQGLSVLFPGVRAGAKSGDGWVDTTTINTTASNGKLTGTTVGTWKVTGIEGSGLVLQGKMATKTTTSSANGTTEIAGTSIQLVTIQGNGPALKGSVESTSETNLKTGPGATPIPVKGTASLTVTRLP